MIMSNALLNHLVLEPIWHRIRQVICWGILLSLGMATYASNASGYSLSFAEVLERPGNKVARCLMMVSPAGIGRYFCLYGKRNEGTVSLSHRDNTNDGKILVRQRFSRYKTDQISAKIQSWLCKEIAFDTTLCPTGQSYEAERIEVIKTIIISDQMELEIKNASFDPKDTLSVNQTILRSELPPDTLNFFTDKKRQGKLYQFARGVHVFLRSLQANQWQSLKDQFLKCKQTRNEAKLKHDELKQTCTQMLNESRQEKQKERQELTDELKKAENELNGYVTLMIGLFITVIVLFIFGLFYLFKFQNKELDQIRQSWQAFSGENSYQVHLADKLNDFLEAVDRLFQQFSSTKGVDFKDKFNQIVEDYNDKNSQINAQERKIEDHKREINAQKNEITVQKDEIKAQKGEIGIQRNQITALTQRETVYESVLFNYFYLPKPQASAEAEQKWKTEIIQQQDIRASLKFSLLGELIACRKAVATIRKQADPELNLCLKVLDIDKIISDYLHNVIQRHFDSDIKMYKEGLITKWLHRVFRAAALLQTYYPDERHLKALTAHLQTIIAMLRATFLDLAELEIQFSEPILLELPPTGCKAEPEIETDFKKLKAIFERVTERQKQGGKFVVDIKYYGMSYENRKHYEMTVIVYNPAWWQ